MYLHTCTHVHTRAHTSTLVRNERSTLTILSLHTHYTLTPLTTLFTHSLHSLHPLHTHSLTHSPIRKHLRSNSPNHSIPPCLEGSVHVHVRSVVRESTRSGGIESGRGAINGVVHDCSSRGALEEYAECSGGEVSLYMHRAVAIHTHTHTHTHRVNDEEI
jgi:hypothetical protein